MLLFFLILLVYLNDNDGELKGYISSPITNLVYIHIEENGNNYLLQRKDNYSPPLSEIIKYDEYIVYGDPTEYEFTTVERKKAAKYGILFNSEKLAFNFMMYHNKILQEQYFYTKEDVAAIFDFNVSFVQKFLRAKDFKMLYVSKSSRDILKSAYEIKLNMRNQKNI